MRINIAELEENHHQYNNLSKNQLLENLSDKKTDWRTKETTQTLYHITDNIEGEFFHKNYLEYLELCWANHYGAVLSPDIVWHTLLNEVASIVANAPKQFAFLFTTTPESKQDICVPSDSLTILPLDLIITELKNRIPSDINLFIPNFSTTTRRSLFSRYVTFADVVSPYYNYSMFACGIPYIDFQGNEEDWLKVANNWSEISGLLKTETDYFSKIQNRLNLLAKMPDDSTFWKEMFFLKRCGSGGQQNVMGWFSEFFKDAKRPTRSENFATHLAKVSYTHLGTGKNYQMLSGIMSSQLNKDLLIPDFSCVVYEKR